jgi:LuxR family maltose regulon positive regulatory protein
LANVLAQPLGPADQIDGSRTALARKTPPNARAETRSTPGRAGPDVPILAPVCHDDHCARAGDGLATVRVEHVHVDEDAVDEDNERRALGSGRGADVQQRPPVGSPPCRRHEVRALMTRAGGSNDGAFRGGRFAAPQPGEGLALRPRVLERLSVPAMRVGVVTAPAGYGKTSHVAALAARDDRPVAWIDLEAGHDDALVLLTDLVAALTTVTDFHGDGLPAGGATADQYATGVAAALGRAVRACTVPVLLVLDDVHRLSDVSATALVGSLVSNVPAGSAVLLVGRACRIGELSRLRVGSTLVEVGAEDLALDAPGVALVLSGMGVDASAEHANSVAAESEGWPVGVRLAGLTALADRQERDPASLALSGREASVSDYLDSEWLWGLTEDERDVLTQVSPLEWLSGPLCNEVLDRHDAGEVLHHIFRNRLLLIPLDRRQGAYRMHGLLRDALEAKLERTDPDGVRLVHQKASAWFETAGDIDRSVRHAVAAKNFDRAERLIVRHTPSLYTSGNYRTIGRWVESLPRDRVARDPALCLCAALTALGLGQGDTLSIWLRLGEHAAESSPEADPVARLCLLDLRSTTTIGPVRPALEDAATAYRGLPPGIWHAASCLAYGGWSWTAGEDGAIEVLTEGVEEAAVHGAPALEAYCSALLAMIAHTERDPARAWPLAARARQVAAEHRLDRAPGLAMVSAMHALASASTGDPRAAAESRQRARTQLAQLEVVSGWANVQTRIALTHTSLLLGDRIGAETMLREAREFLVRQPDATRAHQQVAALEELVQSTRRHSALGFSALTTAELRVLHYLPTNLSLAEIGTRLYVSRYTVKTHCGSIYRKLGVRSRSEAVEAARGAGLLEAEGPADVA